MSAHLRFCIWHRRLRYVLTDGSIDEKRILNIDNRVESKAETEAALYAQGTRLVGSSVADCSNNATVSRAADKTD